MRKYPVPLSAGWVQTLPLLVVALLIIIGSIALSSGRGNPPKDVLSESESGGGSSGSSGGGESNTSTSGSSGSSSSGSSGSSGSTSSTSPSGTPKLEIRKVETEVKNENETEKVEAPELENENEFEVAEGTEEAKVKIGKRENRFLFFEQRFGAESEFPVSVNKTTRELTITTPTGVRTVAVLPDSAVENMLAENVIDRVIGANGRIVEVKVGPDGNLIYEIQGAKDEKFLGLIGVAIPKTVDVSTQNGQLLSVNQSLIDRFLDLISF